MIYRECYRVLPSFDGTNIQFNPFHELSRRDYRRLFFLDHQRQKPKSTAMVWEKKQQKEAGRTNRNRRKLQRIAGTWPEGFIGFYGFFLGFTVFCCVLLCFTVFYCVLLGFIGFYWVWLGLTGFDWVWLGFIGFYWVLLGLTGFDWVWLGLTGFDWVWLGLTEFYWVLLGFIRFNWV